jgi:hypothetical protein
MAPYPASLVMSTGSGVPSTRSTVCASMISTRSIEV